MSNFNALSMDEKFNGSFPKAKVKPNRTAMDTFDQDQSLENIRTVFNYYYFLCIALFLDLWLAPRLCGGGQRPTHVASSSRRRVRRRSRGGRGSRGGGRVGWQRRVHRMRMLLGRRVLRKVQPLLLLLWLRVLLRLLPNYGHHRLLLRSLRRGCRRYDESLQCKCKIK